MTTYRATIYQDQDAESPRDWDNLGVMACWHRDYELGDVQPRSDPQDYVAALPAGTLILPLFLMDHSGVSISTSSAMFRAFDPQGWDWGQVGIIYVTPDKLATEYVALGFGEADARANAVTVLRQEVATYDQYLRGDVYGFTLESVVQCTCSYGEHHEHVEFVDGFGGVYDHRTALRQMLDGIDDDEQRAALTEAWERFTG